MRQLSLWEFIHEEREPTNHELAELNGLVKYCEAIELTENIQEDLHYADYDVADWGYTPQHTVPAFG